WSASSTTCPRARSSSTAPSPRPRRCSETWRDDVADPTVLTGPDEALAAVGTHLGYSDWLEITQERVNQFADATGDHQWIHVDVERAKAGPFGGPIAHGFWTLSSAAFILRGGNGGEGITVRLPSRMGVNYGLNRVRFMNPVPVGK